VFENLCLIPSPEQYSLNFVFSNSVLLSLLILIMALPFSLCSWVHRPLNTLKVSDFSLMNFTQINLEKSSTTTKAYLLPPMLSTSIGPIKSMCRSSRTLEVTWCSNLGWDILVCLPIWHLMSKTASARFYRSSKNRVSFQRGVVQFN